MLISVISSGTRAVVLWSQLIFLPSMMIGGLMTPYSMLPGALGKVALLFPATHAMNVFQKLAQNQAATFNPLWSVVILLAGGIFVLWTGEPTGMPRGFVEPLLDPVDGGKHSPLSLT